ncbi:MAG: PH domain-containing protein [Clostridia bacterium]|nr:PH domain-containing protein [Clostridia bacterium]
MEQEYVVTKSAWSVFSIWYVLLCWLIVPLIIWVAKIIVVKNEKIVIRGRKVVLTSGVLSKKEDERVLTNVLGVVINQSVWGRICRFGTVKVNVIGGSGLDFEMNGVKNPRELKGYLEQYVASVTAQNQMIVDC